MTSSSRLRQIFDIGHPVQSVGAIALLSRSGAVCTVGPGAGSVVTKPAGGHGPPAVVEPNAHWRQLFLERMRFSAGITRFAWGR